MPTMRERLRNLAQWLDEGGIGFDGAAKDAETALLRTLATRMDEEKAKAARGLGTGTEAAMLLHDMVRRLDAPVEPKT